MAICHEHNLREPLPALRPFGIRVRLAAAIRSATSSATTGSGSTGSPPVRSVTALGEMSGRYLYFRPGDQPTLDFETIDP